MKKNKHHSVYNTAQKNHYQVVLFSNIFNVNSLTNFKGRDGNTVAYYLMYNYMIFSYVLPLYLSPIYLYLEVWGNYLLPVPFVIFHIIMFIPFKKESLVIGYQIMSNFINPFPNKPVFLCVCSTNLLKTLWEQEKLLVMSNFSFSHSVFYPFEEFSDIFIIFQNCHL